MQEIQVFPRVSDMHVTLILKTHFFEEQAYLELMKKVILPTFSILSQFHSWILSY